MIPPSPFTVEMKRVVTQSNYADRKPLGSVQGPVCTRILLVLTFVLKKGSGRQ